MLDDLIDLEDLEREKPDIDLNHPQPWFLRFTEPTREEEKKEKEIMFPWPPGAPRPIIYKTKVDLQEVLDFICRPHIFIEEGQTWKQQVSDEPANRTYVQKLNEQLEQCLGMIKSRQTGFCPYRNKMFTDIFAEAVRIAAVDMKVRGLLLIAVRDDIIATMSTYDKLYKSSMAYGIRKQYKLEERKITLQMNMGKIKENTLILEELCKAYVGASAACLEPIREHNQQSVEKMKYDLEILRKAASIIERNVFETIQYRTEKQRRKFLKACLLVEKAEDKDPDEDDPYAEPKGSSISSFWDFGEECSTCEATSIVPSDEPPVLK